MRDEFWLEDQSPDLFDIEDDQTPDSFGAFSGVLVGPPGPPGPQGPPGADGTVSFDELTPAQKESLRGEGVPAGGTTGQVLAKSSNTDYATEWVDQSGGGTEMTILSYGNSTWADFIAAYRANSIVYCRASISTDPSAGSQVRMAAMAYVNHPTVPTSVDFLFYFPATHSDSQQGDQIFVYTLTNANGGTWSFAKKEAYTRIAAGTNMSSSYANGTLTLNATGGGGGTSDYDDLTDKPSINNVTLSGNKTAAELGLGTYSKPSGGIPASDLASAVQTSLGKADSALQSVPSTYRTAAAQDAIDSTQDAAIGIVITGKRPSMAVTAGQYVIVRNSTISGIADGLYTANAALSPSTDVTAANLTAVSNGGLNSVKIEFSTEATQLESKTIAANSYAEWTSVDISRPGKKAIAIVGINTNRSSAVLCGFRLFTTSGTFYAFMKNISNENLVVNSATCQILYVNG